MNRSLGVTLVICLLFGALLASIATAQETTATVRGVIVDDTGSPVADAKVEVLDRAEMRRLRPVEGHPGIVEKEVN